MITTGSYFVKALIGRVLPKTAQHPSTFLLRHFKAFSLVEVTLALGIVSFAMVSVIGLLPVGLKLVKNANEQAAAANVLNVMANSLRTATSTNSVDYSAMFAGKDIGFSVSGSPSPVSVVWDYLNLDGRVDSSAVGKRLSARMDIVPPAGTMLPGRAVISVAWSAQANPTWNPSTQSWSGAEGAIQSGVQFLVRP